jgi:hypothetical protein
MEASRKSSNKAKKETPAQKRARERRENLAKKNKEIEENFHQKFDSKKEQNEHDSEERIENKLKEDGVQEKAESVENEQVSYDKNISETEKIGRKEKKEKSGSIYDIFDNRDNVISEPAVRNVVIDDTFDTNISIIAKKIKWRKDEVLNKILKDFFDKNKIQL